MKYLIPICLVLLIACTETPTNESNSMNTSEMAYDSLLAKEVGADQYGMRRYVMAFLKAGPNRDLDSLESVNLQRAHMDNIIRLAEDNKLILAGPFMDNGINRGIYVFAVETIEEAEELTNSDPAIQAGSLIMELHPWYGSASLMKVNEMHNKLSKNPI